jgi:phosphoribosylanthranilate isomerase
MVKVKICGITSLADALAAVELGADALGFVLAESPRKITLDRLKEISPAIPPLVSRVGVFVNEEAGLPKSLLEDGFLDYAQLHGDEDIQYCQCLPLKKVIKAVRLKSRGDIEEFQCFRGVAALLIDSFVAGQRGGTGKTADWSLALEAKKIGLPIILSGGLNIDNVREAITRVSPYAVDVSSGVEKAPRQKDHKLMETFIRRAKGI